MQHGAVVHGGQLGLLQVAGLELTFSLSQDLQILLQGWTGRAGEGFLHYPDTLTPAMWKQMSNNQSQDFTLH